MKKYTIDGVRMYSTYEKDYTLAQAFKVMLAIWAVYAVVSFLIEKI